MLLGVSLFLFECCLLLIQYEVCRSCGVLGVLCFCLALFGFCAGLCLFVCLLWRVCVCVFRLVVSVCVRDFMCRLFVVVWCLCDWFNV